MAHQHNIGYLESHHYELEDLTNVF